ncbi:MAG: RHS repeat-associated core domain-containing protein, partial [Verrucomicrobia bacterium]|nr:RHS repeat-associated core domain-containing protein [Verrucomicrobiota bacterium]
MKCKDYRTDPFHEYDKAHNRTKRVRDAVETNYTYNNLNQVTNFAEGLRQVAFAYDDNGNRASRTEGGVVDTYAYDRENRLVSLQKGGVPYAYTYDYRTRRVERVEGSTTTQIVFSGGTSVQEYECEALTVEYIRGSDYGGGIGGILYTLRTGGVPSYTHYNNRGDVVAKTDAEQALTYQASYEAFGTRTKEVGQTQDRQKANTKDEDPTGLLNEGFRYRDLETGSFITRDPLGFKDGPNLYTYVQQNPWTKFDPEGLTWQQVLAGGLKVFGGALEFAVGGSVAIAGATASTIGVGIPVAIGGGAIALHGLDTIQSGWRQAVSGKPVDSVTSTILQEKAGLSKNTANAIDTGIGVVGSLGAGVASGLAKVAAIRAAEAAASEMTTVQILKMANEGGKALPNAIYKQLGGKMTTATDLEKAAMMAKGEVTGTAGIHPLKAIQLALTGGTAAADIGGGVIAAATQSAAKVITDTN